MTKYPIQLHYTRRIRLTDIPSDHPNAGVTFQVLQEPTDANPYLYVRREDTGELGFFERERIQEKN